MPFSTNSNKQQQVRDRQVGAGGGQNANGSSYPNSYTKSNSSSGRNSTGHSGRNAAGYSNSPASALSPQQQPPSSSSSTGATQGVRRGPVVLPSIRKEATPFAHNVPKTSANCGHGGGSGCGIPLTWKIATDLGKKSQMASAKFSPDSPASSHLNPASHQRLLKQITDGELNWSLNSTELSS